MTTLYTPREGVDARTRDGQRVTCIYMSMLRNDVLGLLNGVTMRWLRDGRLKGTAQHPLDLVADWTETTDPALQAEVRAIDAAADRDAAFLDAAMIALAPAVYANLSARAPLPGETRWQTVARETRAAARALLRARNGGA